MDDPILPASMRLSGVDILRLPLDEAIPIVQVFLTRNMKKEDREEFLAELDAPLRWANDPATPEKEDDDLLSLLGMPSRKALKKKGTTIVDASSSVVD